MTTHHNILYGDDIRIFIWCNTDLAPGPLKTPCWMWRGYVPKSGYIRIETEYDGNEYGHRSVYRAFKGKIPTGMQVMHRCNNKSCLNPAHLVVGTAKENLAMAIKDGLHPASFRYWGRRKSKPIGYKFPSITPDLEHLL